MAPQPITVLMVAEKPSLAKSIAEFLSDRRVSLFVLLPTAISLTVVNVFSFITFLQLFLNKHPSTPPQYVADA